MKYGNILVSVFDMIGPNKHSSIVSNCQLTHTQIAEMFHAIPDAGEVSTV